MLWNVNKAITTRINVYNHSVQSVQSFAEKNEINKYIVINISKLSN